MDTRIRTPAMARCLITFGTFLLFSQKPTIPIVSNLNNKKLVRFHPQFLQFGRFDRFYIGFNEFSDSRDFLGHMREICIFFNDFLVFDVIRWAFPQSDFNAFLLELFFEFFNQNIDLLWGIDFERLYFVEMREIKIFFNIQNSLFSQLDIFHIISLWV